jgi:hypothetical protein
VDTGRSHSGAASNAETNATSLASPSRRPGAAGSEPLSFLAYFYPQTVRCAERAARAHRLGYVLRSDCDLATGARPLYAGHDQPKIYCLGSADDVAWDDADLWSMRRQIEIARRYGLHGFIFNVYGGHRDGRTVRESRAPLDGFVESMSDNDGFAFAMLWILSGPRARLPIPPHLPALSREPGQAYEVSRETARVIVDDSAPYWAHPRYVTVNGRPYCAVLPSPLGPGSCQDAALAFFDELRDYAERKYSISPYVVGIERREDYYLGLYEAAGLDAVSGYAFLPDFAEGAAAIQAYKERRDSIIEAWARCDARMPFLPPAVVGWDASPRGEAGIPLDRARCQYPYTPILEGSTHREFERMLDAAARFISVRASTLPQIVPICAFNEIAEGCALLPRVVEGDVDFRFLEAVARVAGRYGCRGKGTSGAAGPNE